MSDNPRLYHHSEGNGPDLVLLHGWGMHSGLLSAVGAHLKDRYRIHCFDLPGHGRSPALQRDFTLPTLADMLLAQMPEQAIVVAWSLGGIAALEMARQAPQRIQQVIAVCSTPQFYRSDDWPTGMAGEILNTFAQQLQQDYRETVNHFLGLAAMGSPGMREQLRDLRRMIFAAGEPDRRALQNGLDILAGDSLLPDLDGIRTPVDFIMGGRDRIVHPECGAAAIQRLPRARSQVIEQAGHLPFISHPREFLAQLDDFLGGAH